MTENITTDTLTTSSHPQINDRAFEKQMYACKRAKAGRKYWGSRTLNPLKCVQVKEENCNMRMLLL
jgi:hypothetical protein